MNPFANKTPTELKLLVQGTAVCEECFGKSWNVDGECPTCTGTGKQPPLSDADLDALAAEWCEGLEVKYSSEWETKFWYIGTPSEWHKPPAYTTDPREAMRLQVKYRLGIQWLRDTGGDYNEHLCVCKSLNPTMPIENIPLAGLSDDEIMRLECRAITEAAVLAELTKREEKPVKISEAPPINITGGMDSVEYVRRIREGEDLD